MQGQGELKIKVFEREKMFVDFPELKNMIFWKANKE